MMARNPTEGKALPGVGCAPIQVRASCVVSAESGSALAHQRGAPPSHVALQITRKDLAATYALLLMKHRMSRPVRPMKRLGRLRLRAVKAGILIGDRLVMENQALTIEVWVVTLSAARPT